MTMEELIRYCEEQAEFYKPVTEGRSMFTAIAAKLRTQAEALRRQSQILHAAEYLAEEIDSLLKFGLIDDGQGGYEVSNRLQRFRAAGGAK